MALPVSVPYAFANATTTQNLSYLDSNFNTLSYTLNGIGNGTVSLANVSITGGTISANVSATSINNGTSNVSVDSANGPVSINTNGSNAMYIDASQNVGIGTTSPARQLSISSATQSNIQLTNTAAGSTLTDGFQLQFDGSYNYIWGYENVPTVFGTNNTERMRIDSSGNVGIGTTNTSFGKFTLVCSGTSRTTGLAITPSSDPGDGLRLYCDGTNNPNGIIENVWDSSGSILYKDIFLNPNGGNLLVGTTASVGGNNKVAIHFDKNSLNGLSFRQLTSDAGGGQPVLFNNVAGTGIGSITSGASSVSYNTTSDYRLKENVQPMTTGLATIGALKPVTYDWIADKSAGEGFIAHELQTVIPLAVVGEKDAVDDDGNIKAQGVDYSKIVVHLVAAIQELTAEVTALKAKVGQ